MSSKIAPLTLDLPKGFQVIKISFYAIYQTIWRQLVTCEMPELHGWFLFLSLGHACLQVEFKMNTFYFKKISRMQVKKQLNIRGINLLSMFKTNTFYYGFHLLAGIPNPLIGVVLNLEVIKLTFKVRVLRLFQNKLKGLMVDSWM